MSFGSSDLPSGWANARLSEICTKPQYGWTTKARKEGSGIKFLRTTDISSGEIDWKTVPFCSVLPDEVDKYLLEKGDILVSRAGSVGVSIQIEDCPKAIFGSYLIRFGTVEPVQSKYISLFLKSSKYWSQIADNTAGITIPNVNATKLQQIVLPLAPLEEQRRIVAKAEALFAESKTAREALRRVPILLRRFRQSILAKAFMGELTQRNPNDEPARKLLERIRSRVTKTNVEKRGSMLIEPTERESLPKLPEEWEWATLGLISERIVDCLHSTPKFQGSGKYCIDTTCIDEGEIHFEAARKVYEQTYSERIRRLKPKNGDVLYAREGTIGNAVLVPDNIELCLGQRIMMFRPWPEILSSYFMWGLNSRIVRMQVENLTIGTTAPHVNIADIRRIYLPIAPLEEQRRIITKIETSLSFLKTIEVAVTRARELVDNVDKSILAKAFRGELVPQDPNDEPADVLLERIRVERSHPKKRVEFPRTRL